MLNVYVITDLEKASLWTFYSYYRLTFNKNRTASSVRKKSLDLAVKCFHEIIGSQKLYSFIVLPSAVINTNSINLIIKTFINTYVLLTWAVRWRKTLWQLHTSANTVNIECKVSNPHGTGMGRATQTIILRGLLVAGR